MKNFLKQTFTLLTNILVIMVSQGNAQITINSNEYDTSFGLTILQYTVGGNVVVDLGTAGGPQNWIFSKNDFPGGDVDTITIVDPATTPFASASGFQEADHAWYIPSFQIDGIGQTEAWTYFNLTDTSLQWLGEGAYYEGIPFNSLRTPAAVNFIFPGTYNSTWSNNYTSVAQPLLLRIEEIVNSTSIIDAWGTITLPIGTFDCLRIREDEYSIQTITALGFPYSIDTSQTISYQWVVKNLGLVATVISQNKETDPNFTRADIVSFRDGESATAINNRSFLNAKSITLHQNYPNPFNPLTNIEYRIANTEFVTLKVYNLLGREIETLVNKKQAAGTYSVKWDARNLPSGIYFYVLSAGGFEQTRRMVLLK